MLLAQPFALTGVPAAGHGADPAGPVLGAEPTVLRNGGAPFEFALLFRRMLRAKPLRFRRVVANRCAFTPPAQGPAAMTSAPPARPCSGGAPFELALALGTVLEAQPKGLGGRAAIGHRACDGHEREKEVLMK